MKFKLTLTDEQGVVYGEYDDILDTHELPKILARYDLIDDIQLDMKFAMKEKSEEGK